MPSRNRPEVDATLTICSRTLPEEQSIAVQVANHQPFQLQHAKSRETIADWTSELELDTLIGFNIDPKRYKITFHPLNHPCAEAEGIKAFHKIDLGEMDPPIINSAFEIHFELRDKIKEPTVDDLRKWQRNWALTIADPPPKASKTVFTLCATHHSRKLAKSLDIAGLCRPREGDVETTLRKGLGLISTKDLIKQHLIKELGVSLENDEVQFHLRLENCKQSRDVGDLEGLVVASSDVVKLHVSSVPRRVDATARDGKAESDSEDTDQ